MKEQRKLKERRCFSRATSFPLRDSDKRIIFADRRNNPCRRVSNIAVEWISVYDFHEAPIDAH